MDYITIYEILTYKLHVVSSTDWYGWSMNNYAMLYNGPTMLYDGHTHTNSTGITCNGNIAATTWNIVVDNVPTGHNIIRAPLNAVMNYLKKVFYN